MSQYFLGSVDRPKKVFWNYFFLYMKSIKIIKNTLKIENKNLSYPKTILSRPPKSRSVGFLETRYFLGGGGA